MWHTIKVRRVAWQNDRQGAESCQRHLKYYFELHTADVSTSLLVNHQEVLSHSDPQMETLTHACRRQWRVTHKQR